MENKRKLLYISASLLAGILVLLLLFFFLYEPTYNGIIKKSSQVEIYAHRGFGNHAPDNSLAAAQIAMEKNMDGVDVDGQFTKDEQLIIYHDLSIDRLTTSSGKIKDKTSSELLQLDLATKYGKGFSEAYIKTFEDFVKEITPQGILMVELKVPTSADTNIEEEAVRIIRKYNAHEKVYLSSFNPLVLYRLKQLDPNIRTVFIFMDTNWNAELLAEIRPEDRVDLPWFLQQEWIRRGIRKIIKPDALSVNHEVHEKTIDTLLEKGNPVFLWTIDEEARLKWALQKKPQGIISDEPERAKQLRDAQK